MQWDVLIADDLRLDPAKLPPFVNCARLISTVGVALTAGVFVGLFFLFDASMITELDGKQVCSAMTPLFPGALGISSSQLEDNADMHDSKRETCESYNPPDGPDVKRFTGGLQFDHDVYTARLDVHGTRFYDTEAYRFNVCPISKQVPSAYVLGNYIPDPTVHPNANSQTGMVGKAFSSLVTDGINGDGWDCFNVDFSTESNRDMGVPGLCDVVDDGSRTTFKVMLDPEYPAGTSKPQTATVSGKCDPNLGEHMLNCALLPPCAYAYSNWISAALTRPALFEQPTMSTHTPLLGQQTTIR